MKTFTQEEFAAILDSHDKWLRFGDSHGKRADFTNCDLDGIDLRGVNLSRAIFTNACLTFATLAGAGLRHAKFTGACMWHADLKCADLSGSDINNANLAHVNFGHADLSDVDFTGSDMTGCYIGYANLTNTKGLPPIACPEEGAFIGYKKCIHMQTGVPVIVKLRILENAKRSSALTSKCRCSAAEVLSITDIDGNDLGEGTAISTFADADRDVGYIPTKYFVGDRVEVPNFCDNRWVECAAGIHFFTSRSAAVNYIIPHPHAAATLRWICVNVNWIDVDRLFQLFYGYGRPMSVYRADPYIHHIVGGK